jgi:hypothetical protein
MSGIFSDAAAQALAGIEVGKAKPMEVRVEPGPKRGLDPLK